MYKSAERELTKMLTQVDTQTFVPTSRRTLGDYLDEWLASKSDLAERTHHDYGARLGRYVKPILGHRRLDQLQPPQIQSLYGGMSQRGLSPRSVEYVHRILKQALRDAVRWGF